MSSHPTKPTCIRGATEFSTYSVSRTQTPGTHDSQGVHYSAHTHDRAPCTRVTLKRSHARSTLICRQRDVRPDGQPQLRFRRVLLPRSSHPVPQASARADHLCALENRLPTTSSHFQRAYLAGLAYSPHPITTLSDGFLYYAST